MARLLSAQNGALKYRVPFYIIIAALAYVAHELGRFNAFDEIGER